MNVHNNLCALAMSSRDHGSRECALVNETGRPTARRNSRKWSLDT